MVRLIVLYRPPEDPAAFDSHYRESHAAIVRRYPGLRELRVTRLDGVGGRPPPYYVIAEMAFDSHADLHAAIGSDAGRESARDLRNFAQAGVDILVVDDDARLDA